MKELPTLFSTPMVQAILDGRKTQTRRTKGLEFISEVPFNEGLNKAPYRGRYDNWYYQLQCAVDASEEFGLKCPYGKIGDILWVRETFYAYGHWTKTIHEKTEENGWKSKVEYHFHDLTISEGKNYFYEDCPPASELICKGRLGLGYFKRPSIFMPKEACRIRLEITNIRVERLQDISEEDAKAEGVYFYGWDDYHQTDYKNYSYNDKGMCDDWGVQTAKESYQTLWESINGRGSWEKNPWVWVIEFIRIR